MRLSLLILLFSTTWASAHRIEVIVTIDSVNDDGLSYSQTHVQAQYDDGTPASGAIVELYDSDNHRHATQTLDEHGHAIFQRYRPGTYTIKLKDGMGHAARVEFEIPYENRATMAFGSVHNNRWLMMGLGIVIITGVTFLAKRLKRLRHFSG